MGAMIIVSQEEEMWLGFPHPTAAKANRDILGMLFTLKGKKIKPTRPRIHLLYEKAQEIIETHGGYPDDKPLIALAQGIPLENRYSFWEWVCLEKCRVRNQRSAA